MEDTQIFSYCKITSTDDGSTMVFELPEDDPLFQKKKALLLNKGLLTTQSVQLQSIMSPDSIAAILDKILEMLRIILLDEVELYFGQTDELSVKECSIRNEVAALNSILTLVSSSLPSGIIMEIGTLQALQVAIVDRIQHIADEKRVVPRSEESKCCQEKLLMEWGESHGVNTRLGISCLEGFGRAAVTKTDLKVGDVALEIPASILISEEHLRGSDMYHVLEKIDGISSETIVLLWSMKERHNPDSQFRIYFDTLPKEFNTGLSFGFDAIMMLDGTLLLEEILQAKQVHEMAGYIRLLQLKQHLRNQYEELIPELCDKHPDLFPPEQYSWEHYLWACELWYSNSMKIMFPDGKLRTCLVPIAGFLNHSVNPHVIRYGKVDSATGMLKFPLSRPCRAGDQCFLSYGNFSSSHLITFYGFIAQEENPYDVIPVDIDVDDTEYVDEPVTNWTTHMVRGTWLSSNHGLFHYGLPSPLLDHLRRARCPTTQNNSVTRESLEIEVEILEDLRATFSSMMEAVGDTNLADRENPSWDVKLALEFKDLQRRIFSSILASCDDGTKLVQEELGRCLS